MQVEVLKARYNLKTGQRESQVIVTTKEVDDNVENQFFDLFLSRLIEHGIFQTTSLKAYKGGGENDEKLES